MDKEEYVSKAQELLSQLAYKEIPKDPTNKIKAQLITPPSLEESKRIGV